MAIPDYQAIMLPLLRFRNAPNIFTRRIDPREEFRLSDSNASFSDGSKVSIFGWARLHEEVVCWQYSARSSTGSRLKPEKIDEVPRTFEFY